MLTVSMPWMKAKRISQVLKNIISSHTNSPAPQKTCLTIFGYPTRKAITVLLVRSDRKCSLALGGAGKLITFETLSFKHYSSLVTWLDHHHKSSDGVIM